MMIEYVLGFMFNRTFNDVALIQKKRPDWQVGRLNGIGGHLESEIPLKGMIREFYEETSVKHLDWKYFGNIYDENEKVHLFLTNTDDLYKVKTTTDEEVVIYPALYVLNKKELLPNVPWLIMMATSFGRSERSKAFEIKKLYE
mgnify:CR=1 FL=1